MSLRRTWIAGLVLAAVGASAPLGAPVGSAAGAPVGGEPPLPTSAPALGLAAAEAARATLGGTASAPPDPTGAGWGDPDYRSVRSYAEVAAPVRLRIPAHRIDSELMRVGLAPDGSIAAPGQWQRAGWYEGGPRPGQPGPAVIVGHVDSRSGPAVFSDLASLRTGEAVYVDRQDGTTARFVVTTREQVAKDHFPADRVYAPTLQVSLILMTCGGAFDSASGHYRDNVLVTAVPG